MPKEGDHLEGGGDKEAKEESTQEESVRQRVRADPPGQLVESSPQGEEWASAHTEVKCVSLEEGIGGLS